jgi:small-conductance mechanosensitive channel
MEPAAIDDAVHGVTNALSFLPSWAVAAIVLALAVVASLAVHGVLGHLTRRAFANRPGVISLIARTRALTRLAFVTIALALVLPAIDLPPRAAELFATALPFCFVVLLGWIALIAVDIGVNVYLMRYRLDADDNLLARKHVTQMRVLKRVISTVVLLITAGAALMTIGAVRQVGLSLFASAGVAGIVAGLAARPVLANLIAGVQLAMTQPIRIEDAVIVESEWGWIEEITSTFVVVRLWDLRRMIVPLSYFMEKPFQNWTREGSAILGAVLLYLDYMAPIEAIRAKAAEIVAASRLWDHKVINTQVTDTKERVIEVRVLVSAANASAAFDLRCEVREQLIAFLRNEHPESLPRSRNETVELQVADRHELESEPLESEPPPRRAAGAR